MHCQTSDEPSNGTRDINQEIHRNIPAILLAGLLSMFFAEVMAGSSNLWFFDPFGLALTLILYLMHLLFYLNLAIRTKRTSLVHLYLWGMLFALYEAPITQVLWSGYMDATEQPTLLFGIAIIEFIVLVFFWHPIMSFIIPILVYESLVLHFAKIEGKIEENTLQDQLLPGHFLILNKMKTNLIWILIVFFLLSINQIAADGYNILKAEGAYIGTIFLIWVFWKWAAYKSRAHHQLLSIQDLFIKSKKFKLFIAVLVIYVYIIGSLLITTFLPGRWPTNPIPYLSIIVFAGIVVFMLKISGSSPKPDESTIRALFEKDPALSRVFNIKDLTILFSVLVIGEIVFGILGEISSILYVIIYLSLILVGLVFFIMSIITLVKQRKKKKN
ncbi:MAG: hypothetical protein K9W44_04410 [Candidatus Lokiarchaeota archaeon]|nr:hypothetical protein [Candidatus Harpocratesius repetitus]